MYLDTTGTQMILPTAVIPVEVNYGTVYLRAVLDSVSKASFVTENTQKCRNNHQTFMLMKLIAIHL